MVALSLGEHLADLLDQVAHRLLHVLGDVGVSALRRLLRRLGFLLQLFHQRLRALGDGLRAFPVLRLGLLDGLLHFRGQLLGQLERLLAVLLGLLGRLVEVLELLDVRLVVLVELLRLLDLLLHLAGELLRLLRPLADLLLDLADGLREHRVAALARLGHHRADLLDDHLDGLLHVLGNVLVGLLRRRVARLGFLLRLLEVGLRALDVALCPVPVVLLRLVQRGLAPGDDVLALRVRLLAVLLRLERVRGQGFQLLEVDLQLLVLLLRFLEGLLRLLGELLRFLRGLADPPLQFGDELAEGGVLPVVLGQQRLDLLDDRLDDVLHILRNVLDGLLSLRVAVLGGRLGFLEELLRFLGGLLRGVEVVLLDLLQTLFDFIEAGLAFLIGQLTGFLGGLGLLDDLFDLLEVLLVLLVFLLVLLGLLLDLCGELLRLLRQLADLGLDGAQGVRQSAVALPHQVAQLLHQLRERVLHRLGELLVRFLRLVVAGLGVLLGGLELGLGVLAVLLGVLEVALLDLLQRLLALRDRRLALVPGLLAELLGLLGGLVELLQLLEVLLVLLVLLLDLVVDLLALLVELLRLLRELAHLGHDRVDGLLQGRFALRQHLLDPLHDGGERLFDAVGEVVRDLLQLLEAELRLALALLELPLERIDVLGRLVPLLLLALLDGVRAAVEDRLARLERLVAVLLEEEAGLDPLAPVLVDGVFDLLLVFLELALVLVDGVLDLVDQILGLVDVALQLVADLLLDGLGGVLHRLLGLGDGVLRLRDGLLRPVERVLRAGGDGAEDGFVRRVARLLDGVHHLGQLVAQPLDEGLRHLMRLGGAHLDGALPLGDGDLRERHPRLAHRDGGVRRGDQAGLDALHRAREVVSHRVHGVERRGLHRIERVLGVLVGVLRQLDHAAGRLVRGVQRLLRRVVRRRGHLAGRLAHLAGRFAEVLLDVVDLLLDRLQRGVRNVPGTLLDLLERLLDLVVDTLRRVERLLRALGRLPRRLEHEGRRLLDLLGDLLRLLGGFLQRLGELAQVLHRGGLLLDRVALGAELGGVSRVGEEDVLGAHYVVLAVDALPGLVHLDHGAGADSGVAGDAAFGGDERAAPLVELRLGHRVEQVLLAAGDGDGRLHLAEHLLDQLRAGDRAALLAQLVALLGGRGHVLHLVGVPAAGGDLRDLIEGVHLHHEAADVLPPDQLRGGALADLRLLEAELLPVDVEAEPGDRGPLHEEVVVGQVGLDDVVVDDLAVVDIGGETVALRDLVGEVGVLDVLVRLGERALGEAVALVHAGHQQASGALGREHHFERLHLGLAHRLELALVTELDLDLGAGLELVGLGPLAAHVGEMELEAPRPVHVVGAADADDRAGQLGVGGLTVDDELEGGYQPLVVCRQGRGPLLVRPGAAMSWTVEGRPYHQASGRCWSRGTPDSSGGASGCAGFRQPPLWGPVHSPRAKC